MTMESWKGLEDTPVEFQKKCINTIRFLAVDGVQQANSGHPGMPMEASDLAYLLWTRNMKYNPGNPAWANRDRFVLSAGHGSMLLYAMLHLTGYDLSLEELKNFRQLDRQTPGHPEYGCAPGVETTTGPLGQGFATGVGMAIAERYLAGLFNKPEFPLVDYHIYALSSDGDMMEGISSETASMAGDMGLGKLIYIYLDNHITIEGDTAITFSEDVAKRFTAYNWHVQKVDGYDLPAISKAIEAGRNEDSKPSLIIARTHIAWGSPNKQDTAGAHGSPLGEEEVLLTKKNLDWPETPAFLIPEDVLQFYRQARERGIEAESKWNTLYADYRKLYPELAAQWEAMHQRPDPALWGKGSAAIFPGPGEHRHPKSFRAGSGSGKTPPAGAYRRFRRPGALQQYLCKRFRRVQNSQRKQYSLRHQRTCHGYRFKRHGTQQGAHSLWRHLSGFFRLHASGHSIGGLNGTAGHLCVHP